MYTCIYFRGLGVTRAESWFQGVGFPGPQGFSQEGLRHPILVWRLSVWRLTVLFAALQTSWMFAIFLTRGCLTLAAALPSNMLDGFRISLLP